MITVVGSLNVDFAVSVDRRPKLGETISSKSLDIFYGGKGGNQAVSASKINKDVSLIGAVGNDPYGKNYLKILESNNINTDYISIFNDVPTGMAMITMENNDNSIIYSEGANGKLTSNHIRKWEKVIKESDIIIIQFEVRHEVIEEVINIANDFNIPIVLNPAPYKEFPIEWLEKISYITPNEQEYEEIINSDFYDEKYDEKFIITLGKKGASFSQNGKRATIKAPHVEVVDTTGAGDTFNGVLAHYISIGKSLTEACTKAVYAASLSTTSYGAQSRMPTEEELEKAINQTSE